MDDWPRLLDQVRSKVRLKHYSYRSEQQYVAWIHRFILFHGKRHPESMGAAEVEAFLTHLAAERKVAAAAQSQALAALLFLFRQVLGHEVLWLDNVYRLVASLRYGSGLPLMEALRLRIKDLDFEYAQITVRDGKGGKDRVTVPPQEVIPPLQTHLLAVRERHQVALLFALARKYPGAGHDRGWRTCFPPGNRPAIGVSL